MTTRQNTPAKPFDGDETTHAKPKPEKPAPSQPVKK